MGPCSGVGSWDGFVVGVEVRLVEVLVLFPRCRLAWSVQEGFPLMETFCFLWLGGAEDRRGC